MGITKTTEQFISEAKEIHGETFDYSKVQYKGNKIPVTIICKEHGEFEETPRNHLGGLRHCKKCWSSPKKYTTKKFISRAKEVHGDTYDYSLVEYINSQEKVTIICKKHGAFKQSPNSHLGACGCPVCKSEKLKVGTEEFIRRSKEIFGDRFDYSETKYNGFTDEIVFRCVEHGLVKTTPNLHYTYENGGCYDCYLKSHKGNTKNFIEKAKAVHGDRYDYSKTVYGKSNKDKVLVTCRKHGDFWVYPSNHLLGTGCKECHIESKYVKMDEFLKRAIEIHGDKYDYSEVKLKGMDTKVTIICPTHGPFEQTPSKHINRRHGCQKCGKDKRPHFGKNFKSYTFPSGRLVQVQGSEHHAIDWLLQSGYNENDIMLGSDITPIPYKFEGKQHKYQPDIFIKSENRIIEVKSTYTLYTNYGRGGEINFAKHEASKEAGFIHEIWVIETVNKKYPKLVDVIQ